MSPISTLPPEKITVSQRGRQSPNRLLLLVAILFCVLVCGLALGWSRWWPFRESAVVQDLSEAGDSHVTVRSFRETYFPPGCVLEGMVFQRGPADSKPLITIERLTIRGTYLGVLSQHVGRITAEGMRVLIPAFGTAQAFHTTPSKITVDKIVANGAAVEFASRDSSREPLRFSIHEGSLNNVGWNGPLNYRLKVHNPKPPGEVSAEGKFGVWNNPEPGETPISGKYKFDQADLGVFEGIAGKLSSTGEFSGKLAHIDISGSTDTPDFEVKSGRHPVQLTTKFNAYVDATNGDTFLKHVDADFWKTHIVAEGSIAKSPEGKGKTALIELRSGKARIEDLLRLFVKANRAPMSGSVTLQAHAEISPGQQRFLKKVKLQGAFGISGGTFSPSTQQNVDKLSAGARGEKEKDQVDPETVLTDLKGQVNLLAGTATFSDLSFGVPGAAARMHGTYNVISHKADLRGQMNVDTKISNTTSGGKTFLLNNDGALLQEEA